MPSAQFSMRKLAAGRGDAHRFSHASGSLVCVNARRRVRFRQDLRAGIDLADRVGIVVANGQSMSRARGATGVVALWANREPGEDLDLSSHQQVIEVLEAVARTAPIEELPELIAQ